MFRAIVFAFLLASLFACSSGSSNGRKSGDPSGPGKPDPEPGASYILGGSVIGLTGQLILSNGIDNEFAVVTRNGIFAFPKKIPSGELYNVRVESRPSDQICEVSNSKNFLIRDTSNVIVYCARAVERRVEFNRPINLNLSKLVLASNYQRLGATTSPALQESNNSLQVFDNSYVALNVIPLNGTDPEPILLAHVHDMREYLAAPEAEKRPIQLNVDSTIEALLLMEPTIATAFVERTLASPQALKSKLETILAVVEVTPEYKNLSDKIYSLIAAQKSLLTHGGELNEPLHALVRQVAKELLLTPAQVGFAGESVPASGVALTPRRLASGGLAIDLDNYASRTVAIQSDKFDTLYLAKKTTGAADGPQATMVIPSGVPAQEALQIVINGPGSFGEVSTARSNAFAKAVVRSGTEQHFFPSVNLMLGLIDPANFRLSDCLLAEYEATVAALLGSVDGVADSSQYSAAYNKLFDQLRTRFIGSASDQKLLQEMFACEKFGVGSYIETQQKLNLAKTQVKDLLKVARAAYEPAQNQLDLFANPGMTFFTASIANTSMETSWTYSNNLQLQVVAVPVKAAPGQLVKLQATCLDPSDNNKKVACNIGWDFGDGIVKPAQHFATGFSEENYAYVDEGDYQVTVTARRDEGVQVNQLLSISIRSPRPEIVVGKSDGTPLDNGTGTLDFGLVPVGASASDVTFIVTNAGTAPLTIDEIASSNSAFTLEPSDLVLQPQQSRVVQIRFAPNAVQKYTAIIDIINDTATLDNQIFRLTLTGEGYLEGQPANGGWSVIQNGVTANFVVQRAKVDYLQEGRLAIRIFGSSSSEFPQILLNVPGYQPGQNKSYVLDDTGANGCNGSFVLASPENSFCTSTHPAVSSPITGTIEVTNLTNGQKTVRYRFDAALNAIACGRLDVSQCEILKIDGTASF